MRDNIVMMEVEKAIGPSKKKFIRGARSTRYGPIKICSVGI